MPDPAPATTSAFLALPLELRLQIYSEVILDSRLITVGTAKLIGTKPDIVHRQYGNGRAPFLGIPQDHEPVIETSYSASLLSPAHTAIVHLTPYNLEPNESYDPTRNSYHSLLLLCNQVNTEVKHHFPIPSRRQTSLFVQFPYGLHVLHTVSPQLLRQTRSVHLAGIYEPRTFSPRHAARLVSHKTPTAQRLQGGFMPDFHGRLDDLVRSMFGPDPVHPVEKFEMRIYYPGEDSYSTVWGDDSSPTVIALRNIHLGEVSIEVWRGRNATGVYITARPGTERKRVVSTVWRRLEEDHRGEPHNGDWVVDPAWPDWDPEYSMSDGPKGDMIVSTPVP